MTVMFNCSIGYSRVKNAFAERLGGSGERIATHPKAFGRIRTLRNAAERKSSRERIRVNLNASERIGS
jgi:hypothetical protein